MTVTFDQIDAFLRAALLQWTMAIRTPQKCLRWRTIYANSTPRARGLVIQFPRKQEEGQ